MGLLVHSPGDILRRVLIADGLGADPPLTAWPVYAESEPDGPDSLITVRTTQGVGFGSLMATGEFLDFYGFQVLLRSRTSYDGYKKAQEVRKYLAEDLHRRQIALSVPADFGTKTYLVWCAVGLSQVFTLGQGKVSERYHFSINGSLPIDPVD